MKHVLVLLAFLFISSQVLISQEKEEDEEILPPKRSGSVKIGVAGGFTQHWLSLDLKPINAVLAGSGAKTFDDNGMFLFGGGGYAYILVLPNVRVGGMAAGGSMSTSSLIGNTQRDVKLSASFGGVTADYVVPIVPRLDLAFGFLLGGGGLDLKVTRDNYTPKVWDNIWNEYGSNNDVGEYTRTLSGSFFVYQPTINVEFALLRWLGVRAGVSYLGMSNASWKLDGKYDLLGVPNDVSGKGWMINTGIFLGTFTY